MLTKVSESPPETRRYNKGAYPYYKCCPNTYIQGVAIGELWFSGQEDIKKERVPPGDPGGPFMGVATTYFPTAFCSIIGATGLNFSVRNGKRWTSAL